MSNCTCTAEEVRAGHRPDCPLNVELAPKPVAVRKPFEEMTRDEMIVTYTALRASMAEYVADMHGVCRAGIRLINAIETIAPLSQEMTAARDALAAQLAS